MRLTDINCLQHLHNPLKHFIINIQMSYHAYSLLSERDNLHLLCRQATDKITRINLINQSEHHDVGVHRQGALYIG